MLKTQDYLILGAAFISFLFWKSEPKEKGSSPLDRLNLPNETATANAGHPQSLAAEPRGEQAKPEFFDLGAMLESAGSPPMADSKEISQGEKVYGFEEIFKELKETSGPSAVDPNFNYNLGVASRELGILEDAIEQFQIALEQNQNAFEPATLMGLCYKEKGQWSEAAQALQKALHIQGIPKDKVIEVKYELGLICKRSMRRKTATNRRALPTNSISAGQRPRRRKFGHRSHFR